MTEITDKFEYLKSLNVSDKIEKRKSTDGSQVELSYLSWSYAWAEFKRIYPNATYKIKTFANENGVQVPYMFDKETGYMCMTEVTADGLTYEMWLPVMDSKNKAMKAEPYTYTTKKGDRYVEAANMFDINKTIMRCLVKNLAMFGLGLYIYAGEDLPEKITDPSMTVEEITNKNTRNIKDLINDCVSDGELRSIYLKYKKDIVASKELMNLITEKGNKLKDVA